jgi:starch-binding outer membrane protein SusE/F
MRTIAKSALIIGALSLSFVACKKDKKTVVEEPPVVVTPPPAALKAYLYLPGGYQGANWSPSTADSISSTDSAGKFKGFIKFDSIAGSSLGFLVTPKRNWDRKFGADGAITTAGSPNFVMSAATKVGGSDFTLPSYGVYYLEVDTINKTIKATLYSWGVVGDANGAWPTATNANDKVMSFNKTTKTFSVTTAFVVGEMKFRANKDWKINFGTKVANGPLTELEQDGKNIPVATAGNYTITLNYSNFKAPVATLVKN